MSNDIVSRGTLAAQGFDANRNGRIEELGLSRSAQTQVFGGDSQPTVKQLALAFDRDQVRIFNGAVVTRPEMTSLSLVEHKGGLEGMRRVHQNAGAALKQAEQIVDPKGASNERLQEAARYDQGSIQLRRVLIELRDQAGSTERMAGDIHQKVNGALSEDVKKQATVAGKVEAIKHFGDTRTPEKAAKERHSDARDIYRNLEHAVEDVQKLTQELPDLQARSADLAKAATEAGATFGQLEAAQRRTPVTAVQKRLQSHSGSEAAQVTGRAKPFALGGGITGTVIGVVAGALLRKSVVGAAIGLGIGAAVGSGGGAAIGALIDRSHRKQSTQFSTLSKDVAEYNRDSQLTNLSQLVAKGTLLSAEAQAPTLTVNRGRDLDAQLEATATAVRTSQAQAARILAAYTPN